MNPTVLATVNQKGGVAKTTSCINIGAAMARKGKKVLLVDTDPQASMTISLGNQQPDQLAPTIADLMTKVMNDIPIAPGEGILHHPEGIDLLPANIALAGTEVSLVNAMSRETILKQVLACNRQDYDCIIIDCMPSLGMLTINALAAADRVIIPVQAHYLSAKGLEQLLQTIAKVRRQMNPKAENRRHPHDDGGWAHEQRQGNHDADSGDLRRQNQGVRDGDSAFRPRGRSELDREEYFRVRPRRQGGAGVSCAHEGGASA